MGRPLHNTGGPSSRSREEERLRRQVARARRDRKLKADSGDVLRQSPREREALRASVKRQRRNPPKADTGDVLKQAKPASRAKKARLRAQVKQQRRNPPKAETGDILRDLSVADRRRLLERQYPEGRTGLAAAVLGRNDAANRRRDAALRAFDEAARPERPAKLEKDLVTGKVTRDPPPRPARDREKTAHQAARAVDERAKKRAASHAGVTAPAVAALDQLLRPARASAGAADAVVAGHPERVPKAVVRGLVKNKGPLYSDVLKRAGAPGWVQTIGGLTLDVFLDPTTYVTLGASAPAKVAARKAAINATRRAAAQGRSRRSALRAGRVAAQRVLSDPKMQNKGIQAGVRVKVPLTRKPQIDVRTSGKTTAAISRATGLSKGATRVRESRVVQRHGPELVHDFRPKGVAPAAHERIRDAKRQYRAEVAQTRREAERVHAALRKAIPDPATSRRIIDHIQAGRPLAQLGVDAPTARAVQRILGDAFDEKRAAGLLATPYRPRDPKDARRYIPNVLRTDLEPGRAGALPPRRVGKAKVRPEVGKTYREPLSVYRQTHPHLFSDDLPAILTHSVTKGREKVAVSKLWGRIAQTGRPLNPRTVQSVDLTEEMVFKVTPHGLEPLVKKGADKAPDMAAIAKASQGGAGRHVILPRDATVRLIEEAKRDQLPIGQVFDRAQGYWKTAVTATPGFHVRNLVGDTNNAFMADTTAHAYRMAATLLKAKATRNKQQRTTLNVRDTTPTVTVGGRRYTRRQLLREAERVGAIDQGFMAAEIASQANRSPGRIMRAFQYREDLPRLATYISARERGMSPERAANHVAWHHFDYGDLTATERNIRRYGIPFYTFFARNTRLQATKVLTRPGKPAALAKVLEEASRAAGFSDYEDYAESLPDYQQRGLPIPIKTGDKVTSWSWMPPATDLNALSASPDDFAQNVAQRLTAAKLVAELYINHSLFRQGPIERENAKLVPAPQILGDLPASVRRKLGVEQFTDRRRGLVWGWPARVDYVARQTPQTNVLIQLLTPVPGSRGRSGGQQLTGALTGFRPNDYKSSVEDETLGREMEKLAKLTQQRNNLLRTPKARDAQGYASPALVKLRKQIKAQDARVKSLRAKRGDIESRPVLLSPFDQLQRELDEMQAELADPSAALRKQSAKLQEELDRMARGGP